MWRQMFLRLLKTQSLRLGSKRSFDSFSFAHPSNIGSYIDKMFLHQCLRICAGPKMFLSYAKCDLIKIYLEDFVMGGFLPREDFVQGDYVRGMIFS